jgi:hypothetical protein
MHAAALVDLLQRQFLPLTTGRKVGANGPLRCALWPFRMSLVSVVSVVAAAARAAVEAMAPAPESANGRDDLATAEIRVRLIHGLASPECCSHRRRRRHHTVLAKFNAGTHFATDELAP